MCCSLMVSALRRQAGGKGPARICHRSQYSTSGPALRGVITTPVGVNDAANKLRGFDGFYLTPVVSATRHPSLRPALRTACTERGGGEVVYSTPLAASCVRGSRRARSAEGITGAIRCISSSLRGLSANTAATYTSSPAAKPSHRFSPPSV